MGINRGEWGRIDVLEHKITLGEQWGGPTRTDQLLKQPRDE